MEYSTQLTRGKIAKKLNINSETVRYYETQKLIKKPTRLQNNYRVYNEEDVARIQFITMAKQLGFSLREIKELLNLSLTSKSDRKKVRDLAARKSNLINEKIIQLTRIKKTLDKLIIACQSNENSSYCPILRGYAFSR